LRERAQGKGHWQTIDARLAVERWQRLAGLPEKTRAQIGTALLWQARGRTMRTRGNHPAADFAFRRAVREMQSALGEEHAETALCYNSLAMSLEQQGKSCAS